jgi:hypothetical protein
MQGVFRLVNLNVLDALNPQLQGVTNYPYNRLQEFGSLLQPFSGSQQTGATAPSFNTLGKIGGALQFAGSPSGQNFLNTIGGLF